MAATTTVVASPRAHAEHGTAGLGLDIGRSLRGNRVRVPVHLGESLMLEPDFALDYRETTYVDNLSLSAGVSALYKYALNDDLNLYAGPGVGWSYYRAAQSFPTGGHVTVSNHEVTARAQAGAEYYLTDRVSLGSMLYLNASYRPKHDVSSTQGDEDAIPIFSGEGENLWLSTTYAVTLRCYFY
jgi:opacity protein-like surface antigen